MRLDTRSQRRRTSLSGLLLLASLSLLSCSRSKASPAGREASPARDGECGDPARPKAFFYPAENRTHYTPDDPFKDGCVLLVPDHLFCCPETSR